MIHLAAGPLTGIIFRDCRLAVAVAATDRRVYSASLRSSYNFATTSAVMAAISLGDITDPGFADYQNLPFYYAGKGSGLRSSVSETCRRQWPIPIRGSAERSSILKMVHRSECLGVGRKLPFTVSMRRLQSPKQKRPRLSPRPLL